MEVIFSPKTFPVKPFEKMVIKFFFSFNKSKGIVKKTINLWAINQLYNNTKSTHSFSYFLAENGVFSTFLQEKEVQGLQSFLNLRKQTIIISYFLKAVFHKFYLVHSWIPWPILYDQLKNCIYTYILKKNWISILYNSSTTKINFSFNSKKLQIVVRAMLIETITTKKAFIRFPRAPSPHPKLINFRFSTRLYSFHLKNIQ